MKECRKASVYHLATLATSHRWECSLGPPSWASTLAGLLQGTFLLCSDFQNEVIWNCCDGEFEEAFGDSYKFFLIHFPSSCLFWKYTCPSPTTNHQSNTINHQASQQPTTNQVREPASHNGQFKVLGLLLRRLGFACCLYRHSRNPSIPSSQVWAMH